MDAVSRNLAPFTLVGGKNRKSVVFAVPSRVYCAYQLAESAMRHSVVWGTFAVAMLCGAISAPAQHTLAAKFDLTKPLTLTGTVTQIDWANPYVHVLMKVDGKPVPTLWAVELDSGPIILANNGWSETSLAAGEVIKVDGFAARNKSNQISGKSVVITRTGNPGYGRANGTPRAIPVATGPTPRWPSGQPRLGPPPGQTGYWGYPTRTSLVESGVTVDMDAYGLLKNIADAAKVAPMQPWAL